MDAGAVYRCTVIRMGSLYLASANIKSDIDDDEKIASDTPIIQLLITCSRGKLDRLVRWLAQACFVQ